MGANAITLAIPFCFAVQAQLQQAKVSLTPLLLMLTSQSLCSLWRQRIHRASHIVSGWLPIVAKTSKICGVEDNTFFMSPTGWSYGVILLWLRLGLGYILMPTQRFTLDKKILHILPWQLLTKSSPTLHRSDQENGWLSCNTNILIWRPLYCDRRPLSSSLDDVLCPTEGNLVVISILTVWLNKSGRQERCCGSETEHTANGECSDVECPSRASDSQCYSWSSMSPALTNMRYTIYRKSLFSNDVLRDQSWCMASIHRNSNHMSAFGVPRALFVPIFWEYSTGSFILNDH